MTPSEDQDDELSPEVASPLWLVSQEPVLNELVLVLQRYRDDYERGPHPIAPLRLSRGHLEEARTSFEQMIRRGERRLHQLCGLLADRLIDDYRLQSLIIGEVEESQERFVFATDIERDALFETTDATFGRRRIERLRFVDGMKLHRASVVSSAIEYQALRPNRYDINKILSRVKAEEEIWNKVVDEIFDLDGIVLRDKDLRHLSRYVKDVFGVKIVVGSPDAVYRVQEALVSMRFSPDELEATRIDGSTKAHERLEMVEVKDYVAGTYRKRSGWSALKSVVRWGEKTFEIQVQPLGNFLHERERLTRESHSSFKSKRELLRAQIATRVPLFGFYGQLLRWLFVEPESDAPALEGFEVEVSE